MSDCDLELQLSFLGLRSVLGTCDMNELIASPTRRISFETASYSDTQRVEYHLDLD